MEIPINRVVAFVGPVINVVAGALAAWLIAKVNILAIPGLGLNGDDLAIQIAGALSALLTAGLLWLGQRKWLQGHHIELQLAGYEPLPHELLDQPTVVNVVDTDRTPAMADDEMEERVEFALDGGQELPEGLTETDPSTIPPDVGDAEAR